MPQAVPTRSRVTELFEQYQFDLHQRTDRLFAGLLGFQWIAGILFALWISPLAWSGTVSRTHLHVWAAIVLGGLISGFPILLAVKRPGSALTRHVIAAGQMLNALDFYLGPVREIAVVGESTNPEVIEVLRFLRRPFRPHQVVAWQAGSESNIAFLSGRGPLGEVTTYVCENFTCQAPIVGAKALRDHAP